MTTPLTPGMTSMFIAADGLDASRGAKTAPSSQAVEKFERLLGAGAAAHTTSSAADSTTGVSAVKGIDHYVVPSATFTQRSIPEPLARYGAQASHKLRAAMESKGVTIAPEVAERFPELELMNEMSRDMREFMVAEIEFRFVNKTVESTEKNVQTLFRQQG